MTDFSILYTIPMKSIRQSYTIHAPIETVWQALIDPMQIKGWGAGPNVIMDEKVGTKFVLWEGEIHGVNLEVVKNKKLVQEWYSSDSPKHPTHATFILTAKDDKTTKLELLQENVNDKDEKSLSEGWKQFYLGPLKKYLEK